MKRGLFIFEMTLLCFCFLAIIVYSSFLLCLIVEIQKSYEISFDYGMNEKGEYVISRVNGGRGWVNPRAEEVIVPSSYQAKAVVGIGNNAFKSFAQIDTIVIEEGIRFIGDEEFKGVAIQKIKLPQTLLSIGERAFEKCEIETIEIPDSVREIKRFAFSACSKLKSVRLPEGLREIEEGTFYQCNGITSMTIPEGVKIIGKSAFSESIFLNSITLPESLTVIKEQAFMFFFRLNNINLPKNLTKIGASAFFIGLTIQNLEFPPSLISIGDDVFGSCKISRVYLSSTIEKMGKSVFYGCVNLKQIIVSQMGRPPLWDKKWDDGQKAKVFWRWDFL